MAEGGGATTAPAASFSDLQVAARLGGEFFIRGIEIAARAQGGDLLRGIIFTAIAVANSEHLGAGGETSGGATEPRPVSVLAISNSIGVPYETTRRYVNMMVRDGQCVRHGRRGVVIPEEAFLKPGILAAMQETLASFNRLASTLRRLDYAPSVSRR
ncbi:hypothetical protein QO010_002245 [Caulobacter ginsengisoli]|uniref:HTH iclR-type domain-containing protein n=1 Tax=Caulobacter ginsengisoli TaxID=400775 RepID=A0ABU0IR70_9CAUL|nr:hypothetical protein [Caulobacter ginsengisoli]MDQ0464464.1 hypothetical protein [Caulobacter ginsengisoli]